MESRQFNKYTFIDNPDAVIVRPAENKASIRWKPSQQDQNQLAEQGITGKFVVQYEIERELSAGEVLVGWVLIASLSLLMIQIP